MAIFDQLLTLADEFGFEVHEYEYGINLRIPCSSISLRLERINDATIIGAYYVQTNSWEWTLERSDLNDILSTLVATYLAQSAITSCALIDIPNPAARVPEGEVYARYVTPTQPGYFLQKEGHFPEAEQLIRSTFSMEQFLHQALPLHPSKEEQHLNPANHEELESWAAEIAEALGERSSQTEDTFNQRSIPPWLYYRCAGSDISIIQSEHLSDAFDILWGIGNRKTLAGVNGSLIIREALRNYVSADLISNIKTLLSAVTKTPRRTEIRVIPLENCIVTADQETVVFVGALSGRQEFDAERAAVLTRHQQEAKFLFPPESFTWSLSIDGGRFENLVFELLLREPGVESVRTVGHANERDGGRDHIALWRTPMQSGSVSAKENEPLARPREVIVQCKALKKAVGKRQIPDVRDTIDQYHAHGYLLVAAGAVGTTAIDYLTNLRRLGDYYTDWWGRNELEDRLRRSPDIRQRYQDIVRTATS
jgi:hypothetical protein